MATFTNQSKSSTTWVNASTSNLDLLIEGTQKLLIETGYGLLLSSATTGAFSNTAKNSSSWTNQSMN